MLSTHACFFCKNQIPNMFRLPLCEGRVCANCHSEMLHADSSALFDCHHCANEGQPHVFSISSLINVGLPLPSSSQLNQSLVQSNLVQSPDSVSDNIRNWSGHYLKFEEFEPSSITSIVNGVPSDPDRLIKRMPRLDQINPLFRTANQNQARLNPPANLNPHSSGEQNRIDPARVDIQRPIQVSSRPNPQSGSDYHPIHINPHSSGEQNRVDPARIDIHRPIPVSSRPNHPNEVNPYGEQNRIDPARVDIQRPIPISSRPNHSNETNPYGEQNRVDPARVDIQRPIPISSRPNHANETNPYGEQNRIDPARIDIQRPIPISSRPNHPNEMICAICNKQTSEFDITYLECSHEVCKLCMHDRIMREGIKNNFRIVCLVCNSKISDNILEFNIDSDYFGYYRSARQ